jgi:hypothetical protein
VRQVISRGFDDPSFGLIFWGADIGVDHGWFCRDRIRKVSASQPFGCQLYRFNDLPISRAAADVSGDGIDNLGTRWVWIAFEKCVAGEDHAWRTKAALHPVRFTKSVLQDAEFPWARRHSLDCCDFITVSLDGEQKAGAYWRLIDQNGTRPANPMLASCMGSSQRTIFAQCVKKRFPRLDVHYVVGTVHPELYIH